MGRLTLNVLLSFAQFEREVTSERIRDKIAASKRKCLWVGGPLLLGYAMKDGKITVVEDEAERVRLIYRRYLELSGVNALVRDLSDKDIRTKTRLRATGVTAVAQTVIKPGEDAYIRVLKLAPGQQAQGAFSAAEIIQFTGPRVQRG